RSLIIAKEEQLVLDDGPADRAAELVPPVLRNEAPGYRIGSELAERVAGLGGIGAPEPETGAMQRIAARPGLHGHDTRHRLAKLRVEVLRRHLGFGYRIDV